MPKQRNHPHHHSARWHNQLGSSGLRTRWSPIYTKDPWDPRWFRRFPAGTNGPPFLQSSAFRWIAVFPVVVIAITGIVLLLVHLF